MVIVHVVNKSSEHWGKTATVKPEDWASDRFWVPVKIDGRNSLMYRRNLG